MHLLGLSIAAHTPDSLRFARPILVIGRGEERGEEDGMVGVREIAIHIIISCFALENFKRGGGKRNLRPRSALIHDVQQQDLKVILLGRFLELLERFTLLCCGALDL